MELLYTSDTKLKAEAKKYCKFGIGFNAWDQKIKKLVLTYPLGMQ